MISTFIHDTERLLRCVRSSTGLSSSLPGSSFCKTRSTTQTTVAHWQSTTGISNNANSMNSNRSLFTIIYVFRRSWYNMSFFFFFWNLFLGVVSALLRVLRGIVFGVFFIPRIDRPVLMTGFERFDAGRLSGSSTVYCSRAS